MKVLLLTQYYTPEPVEKFADLARSLAQQGHEVEVLTSFPCYPLGRVYQGFRQRICQTEHVDGYTMIRVPQVADHSRSVFRRALYYFSFALSAATIGLFKVHRADVILVYQSALPTGLAAWLISRLRRMPYVLDVVDLWPESVTASGMLADRWIVSLIRGVARFVYRGAAHVNVITHGYRENLLAMGVPDDKLSVIHYWVAEGAYSNTEREEQCARQYGMEHRFNVVYAGAMGPCQQLRTALEAARLLSDLPDFQLLLVGDGLEAQELAQYAQQNNLTNVRFLGRLPAAEVAQINACADMLLVHLKPDAMSRVSIPSKTFACMASGRPLLMAVEGEASELVQNHGCGVAVPPSQPEKLAEAIREFRLLPVAEQSRMGQAARSAYLKNYSSQVQIKKFVELLERVTSPKRRGSSFYLRFGKRLFDVLVAGISLIVLAPVILAVAVLVRIKLGRPILFQQVRPGLDGKPFKLVKFRTMLDSTDKYGRPLPDVQRLTKFGKFLRSSSLDELPELWNILRGEMSLVGPRPLLTEYLGLYSPEQLRRHDVLPGLTGWAQIQGRNELSWEEKFRHDAWYVENVSFWLDLKIIFRTILKVLKRDGVNQAGHATAAKFTGSTPSPGVIVLGAGGHAKVVISTLLACGRKISGVYDDDPQRLGCEILGHQVVGRIVDLPTSSNQDAVIAIGDGTIRQSLADHYSFNWITLIHPTAWVDPSASISAGTVVMAGAVVQPDCRIGKHVVINTSASVDHDCELDDLVHVGPGAHLAGLVRIGQGTLVGTGSVAIPGVEIGSNTVIGAGSVVTADVPSGVTAVGQPARVIKRNHWQAHAA
jgi:sugar O-acyltransferase (sialic acid O-acetyltransferase NeuD family)